MSCTPRHCPIHMVPSKRARIPADDHSSPHSPAQNRSCTSSQNLVSDSQENHCLSKTKRGEEVLNLVTFASKSSCENQLRPLLLLISAVQETGCNSDLFHAVADVSCSRRRRLRRGGQRGRGRRRRRTCCCCQRRPSSLLRRRRRRSGQSHSRLSCCASKSGPQINAIFLQHRFFTILKSNFLTFFANRVFCDFVDKKAYS